MKRGRKVVDERPLFPGYVFAGVDPYREAWQRLLDVDGVIDVLGRPSLDDGRLPSHVPAAWIEAIQRAEAAGIFDRTVNNASKFRIGERVRVSDGPFAGMTALIEEFIAKMRSTTAKKRAKVLMDFMGRAMRFDVDVAQLEKL